MTDGGVTIQLDPAEREFLLMLIVEASDRAIVPEASRPIANELWRRLSGMTLDEFVEKRAEWRARN